MNKLKLYLASVVFLSILGCSSDNNKAPDNSATTSSSTANSSSSDNSSSSNNNSSTNNSSSSSEETQFEISAAVIAAEGGRFTSQDGNLTLIIPENALTNDAQLNVTQVASLPTADNLEVIGQAYNIDLGNAQIVEDITLEITIDEQPLHPQLAEIAFESNGSLANFPANFYRQSNNTVLALTQRTGVVAPVFRTLKSESGDGVARGQAVFVDESFGNEAFFGDVVGLHTLLNGLTPSQALGAGVHINLDRVPEAVSDVLTGNDFAAKQTALENPAVTRTLLLAGAVIGVKAIPNQAGDSLISAGITCALCHATAESNDFELTQDNVTSLPIGRLQLNGVPNTQINVGAILALTPFAQNAGQETVDFLNAFGPGAFDPRALPDNPLDDGILNPTSIPQIWNFVDLEEQGYAYNWDGLFKGENSVASQAEAVYDLIMHANGSFATASGNLPPALSVAPPQTLVDRLVAAEDNAPGNDIVTQDLLDLQAWERSIVSPTPENFDEALAEQGFKLFYGDADCVRCHSSTEFTGPILSTGIVLNPPQGDLAEGIKTPGLRGVAQTAPFFHDSSAASLTDVMQAYSGRIVRSLNADEINALAEYMKSL